jgi:hypothetical protein
MFLGKGSGDKQADADNITTVRRASIQHSPVGARRSSMPTLTEVQLSTTTTPSAALASSSPTATSSAATHETKHTTTNSRLQSSTSANLPAVRDEATLSLLFQVMSANLQAGGWSYWLDNWEPWYVLG